MLDQARFYQKNCKLFSVTSVLKNLTQDIGGFTMTGRLKSKGTETVKSENLEVCTLPDCNRESI